MTDLEMSRGTDRTFTLTILDSERRPIDISGATMRFMAKKELDDSDADAVIVKTVGAGITLSDPTNGIATLTIEASDTEVLDHTYALYYDVRTEKSGNQYRPIEGVLLVHHGVQDPL